MPHNWILANEWILIVGLTAGFGGFVHGILRPTPVQYPIALPLSDRRKDLGFLGDIFVGIAAGAAIFFVMDSIFGLKVETTDQQTYLKVVALGVISGYLGVSLLDTISLFISKRLVKQQQDVEREQSDLEELKQRAKAASKAADLRSLADAYWRWGMARNDTGMLDQALVLFDAAISADPKNPENYIKKSFVYAEKAKREKDKKPSYDMAIALTNAAIKVDESSARAYYDRACYKHLNGVGKLEVLHDLELGIQRNDMVRKLAKLDPDLEDLLEDADFKKLVATETAAIVLEKAAANA